jgi:hypothetical protein
MAPMRKRTALAVTFAVWLVAFGSAAALTYDFNRPLPRTGVTSLQAALPASDAALVAGVEQAPRAESVAELRPVLHIPTVTIVGRAPSQPARPHARPADGAIGSMRCAEWRGLDIGSGGVQVCVPTPK